MKKVALNDPVLIWTTSLVFGILLIPLGVMIFSTYTNIIPRGAIGLILKLLFFVDGGLGVPVVLILALIRGDYRHNAARTGRIDIFLQESENKLNLNRRTLFGYTPLHIAVLNKKTDVVEALLKMGVDPRLQNIWGCSPLQSATKLKELEIAEKLARFIDS